MRLLCWAAGLAAAAAAGVFAATYVMIKQNMRPERARDLSRPEERAGRRWEPYAGQLDEGIAHIRAAAWEERWITSFDGLRLHGRLLRGEGKRSVLLVHGYHSSGENDFCGIFDYYASRGYNILLIDQRGHALSGGASWPTACASGGTCSTGRAPWRGSWAGRYGCTAFPWAGRPC